MWRKRNWARVTFTTDIVGLTTLYPTACMHSRRNLEIWNLVVTKSASASPILAATMLRSLLKDALNMV